MQPRLENQTQLPPNFSDKKGLGTLGLTCSALGPLGDLLRLLRAQPASKGQLLMKPTAATAGGSRTFPISYLVCPNGKACTDLREDLTFPTLLCSLTVFRVKNKSAPSLTLELEGPGPFDGNDGGQELGSHLQRGSWKQSW